MWTTFVLVLAGCVSSGGASGDDTGGTATFDTGYPHPSDSDPADTDRADTRGLEDTSADTDPALHTDTDPDTDPSSDTDTDSPVESGWTPGPRSCLLDSGETAAVWLDTGTIARFAIDGDPSDWDRRGRFTTSSPPPSRATLGWDQNQLLLGLYHDDLAAPPPDLYLVVYLGDSTATHRTGLMTHAQEPALADPARWAVRWRVDGAPIELWRAAGGAWRQEPAPRGLQAVAHGPVVELGVPVEVAGCDHRTTATWMLVDGTHTYAASPAAALVDGADPDVGCTYTVNPNRQNAARQMFGDCGQPRPERVDFPSMP